MKKIPIKKVPVINSEKNLEWIYGAGNSDIVIENKRLNFKILRQKIVSINDVELYDTFSIQNPKNSSIALIINHLNEIGLVNEWRPIPEKWFWACVRGFGSQNDNNYIATAKRESLEEIGNFKVIDHEYLGDIYPDTAFYENPIGIVLLKVVHHNMSLDNSEGINQFQFFSTPEIKKMIFDNEITCCYTLSALNKYFIKFDM